MTGIAVGIVLVLLVAVVVTVVRSHRPARRAKVAGALEAAPTVKRESTRAPAAPPAETTAPAQPAPPVKAVASPQPAVVVPPVPKISSADITSENELPDEPVTIVTQRFQPQAFQNYLDGVEASDGESLPFGFILVSAVGRTDVGRRRKHNEDSYLALAEEHLFAVADGMGGHAAGEVASAIAVETMLATFRSGNFPGSPTPERPRRADELVRSIEAANRAIFDQAQTNAEQAGMGTTIVAARFAPSRQRVFIAHAGDSRCYRLRDGEFKMLTQDHTMSAWGVGGREGEKLTRALGIMPTIEVDVSEDAPIAKDQYLLCSDGLTKMLGDDDIAGILRSQTEPEETVRKLIEAANEKGGRDNITAIVIQVHETASFGSKASTPPESH
jgi:protein phosphatase